MSIDYDNKLRDTIDSLRKSLEQKIELSNLHNNDLLKLSRHLDEAINEYNKTIIRFKE